MYIYAYIHISQNSFSLMVAMFYEVTINYELENTKVFLVGKQRTRYKLLISRIFVNNA